MSDPSSQMESKAILEGFKSSVELHGLIYRYMVSDNDSSVYKAICDGNPYKEYDIIPQRILCTNHLLRNLCRKLYTISKITQSQGTRDPKFIAARNIIGNNVLKIRKEIISCIKVHQQSDVSVDKKNEELRKDIIALPSHIFGSHEKCCDRNFSCEEFSNDHVKELERHGFYQKVEEVVRQLSVYSGSLLHGATTNMAESYNSLVCKKLGGKRVDFSHENQYKARTSAAAVAHNTQATLEHFYSTMGKEVPSVVTDLERERRNKVEKTKISRMVHNRDRSHNFKANDGHYGENCMKIDLPAEEFEHLKLKLFDKLLEYQQRREEIEKETISQGTSRFWQVLRKNMLTASNFGRICKMKPTTLCANIVKNILYGSSTMTESMRYGCEMESKAREQLEKKLHKKIELCGLFIDMDIPYLGASPDGLIDDDGIVEIKCPSSVSQLSVEDVVQKSTHMKNLIDFGAQTMKRNHMYHYQVQGQLHITKRKYCIFAIFTKVDLQYIRVERDDTFWKEFMEEKLKKFYMNCLLPEIVDSRYLRSMDIREPKYIIEAQKRKITTSENSKTKKNKVVQESCVIDSNHNGSEVVDESDESMTCINQFAHLNLTNIRDKIAENVLPLSSWLDDLSIDSFLKIVKDTTCFETHSTQFLHTPQKIVAENKESIQIIGGNFTNHWRCVYFDGSRVQIYDSLWRDDLELCDAEKDYLRRRFPCAKNIEFVKMLTRQPDSHSCGIYAAAFATDLTIGRNPSELKYSMDISKMRNHLFNILVDNKLTPFPQCSDENLL